MTGGEIRQAFIKYFESKEHKHVRSSSTIPYDDPTILFTNAGMNQFKNYFLGNETPEFLRAVTVQKVMRAGGKHNDLENVGRTDRHHTFFEMLGNFSFGDYFKENAIEYAWEFLVDILKLPQEKLAISVFQDDDESIDLWKKITGIENERIARLGEKENFWSMGDTGPCGPCSEIHYRLRDLPAGRTPAQCLEDDDGTYLEIWNLVFMQFDRSEKGELIPLPKPSIDTGMGLERITAIMQQKLSNYDSDIFQEIIQEISRRAKYKYGENREKDISCRVIADHIRSSCFLIVDGVLPSNEGRGYVLRRIIRRAARHGRYLQFSSGFLSELSKFFASLFFSAYPELTENTKHVVKLLYQEEERFSITLHHGMKILEELIQEHLAQKKTTVSGKEIFKLYDTYGFPVDLAKDVLEDNGLSYERSDFESAMAQQRHQAQDAQKGSRTNKQVEPLYVELAKKQKQSEFVGYHLGEVESKILAVIKDSIEINELAVNDRVELIFEKTPFYAEGGGQIGDQGYAKGTNFVARIIDTQKPVSNTNISSGIITETTEPKIKLNFSQKVRLNINSDRRNAVEYNHTATHLAHGALRSVLGEHVKQAGSLVEDRRFRFDFNHYSPMTANQIRDVEGIVNDQIRLNFKITDEQTTFHEAVEQGAMAIFGEKYGDVVRLVKIGDVSKELCGGTHTTKTGNIGLFKIISENSVASGIRRIEAMTGRFAFEYIQKQSSILESVAGHFKVAVPQIEDRIAKIEERLKQKEQEIEKLTLKIQKLNSPTLEKNIEKINDIRCFIENVDERIDLKARATEVRSFLSTQGVVLLNQIKDEKISLLLTVTPDLAEQEKYAANKLIEILAKIVGGRGGGKPDMARCGGKNISKIPQIKEELRKLLS